MCDAVNWYTDFVPNNSFGGLIVIINLISAYKAGRNARKLNTSGVQMTKIQKQREIYFIKQTFFQGTSVFTGLVSFYILAPLFTNEVVLCVLSTFWAFMQGLEGIIIFASNREMRSVFWKKRSLSPEELIISTFPFQMNLNP
uniref:7TM_GPCR_Srx domain-containing protein n=1 Tax=Caenorhabditis tropicalis TaxID=1561998 RepID=A0A1I7T3Y6_9PELO